MKADFKTVDIKKLPSVFLYSTHEAYLTYKLNTLLDRFTGIKTEWMDQASFLKDPGALQNQGDLFASEVEDKIVIIPDATDKSYKTIEAHLQHPNPGVTVMIPALVGASVRKLKGLHEKAKNAGFLACYLSTHQDKKIFLDDIAAQGHVKLSQEAYAYAFGHLETDIEAVLSGIEKLEYYVDDPLQDVSLDILQACMSDFREANVGPVIQKIGDRNLPQTLRAYHEAKTLGLDETYLLRSLGMHFNKLLTLRASLSKGMNISQAMQAMRPPIFFKQQDEFKRHVNNWSEKDIISALSSLSEIELKLRTGYPYDPVQLWKPIFSKCRMPR